MKKTSCFLYFYPRMNNLFLSELDKIPFDIIKYGIIPYIPINPKLFLSHPFIGYHWGKKRRFFLIDKCNSIKESYEYIYNNNSDYEDYGGCHIYIRLTVNINILLYKNITICINNSNTFLLDKQHIDIPIYKFLFNNNLKEEFINTNILLSLDGMDFEYILKTRNLKKEKNNIELETYYTSHWF